jgi:integrase/recombinase XerD
MTAGKKPPVLGALHSVSGLARHRLGRLSTDRLVEGYVLAKCAEGRAPATVETIEKRLARLVAFAGDRTIDVELVRRWLVALKAGRRGRPTSDVYVEDHRKEAAAFFEWCVRERMLSRSPMATIGRYRVTRPAVRTLTRDEIARLLDLEPEHGEGMRNRAVLAFMYDTGVRIGELVRIRVGDVDLTAGAARIVGKNRIVETVPLSAKLRAILWAYLERARPRELFDDPEAPLFVERGGGALTTNAVRQWMRRAKIRAGIDSARRVSPHVIRASAATHFAAAGASAFVVQRFLRHRTIAMSQRYVALGEMELERLHAQASPLQRLARGA